MSGFNVLFLLIGATFAATLTSAVSNGSRSFVVDYNNSRFLMDGEPFRYVAGEMHYFRIPKAYWKDRLLKLKNVGANTVQTYIEWSHHEPSSGQYRLSGEYDVYEYIKLAQQVGLNVILRPGPYICAEREFGGYPAWLLSEDPNIQLRTSDTTHTYYVKRWLDKLMVGMEPLLYGNGGPVIMIQVENEYGSYPINDQKYLAWLRDLYHSYVNDNAVLFTTDGAGTSYITRGHIPGVFTTIDFGASSSPVSGMFDLLKTIQPSGPWVNSEYYVGWLSYWAHPFATVDTDSVIATMKDMLDNNVSFSMYMFHGGTSFGFSAGSGSDTHYLADLTSYDYDAPVTEAGDLTPKYFAIKNLLSQYFEIDDVPVENSKKGNYGAVKMNAWVSLFDSPTGKDSIQSRYPLTFEQIGQSYGFVSYQTTIDTAPLDPSALTAPVRDRGIVYVDEEETSVLMYTVIDETPLPTWTKRGQSLRILVENMGRRNYQLMSDCTKGLVSNVTLDGSTVLMWNITGYPLNAEDIAAVENMSSQSPTSFPAFYRASFQLPEGQEPLDTFLDMSGWRKGLVFVNGFNLGRYWHVGPQMTLYVPGVYLQPYPALNNVTLLELHYSHRNNTITFTDTPKLNNAIR